MKLRVVLAVFLNVVAIAVPAMALLVKYGQETRVAASSVEHLVALLAVVLVSFTLSLVASTLLRKDERPQVLNLLSELREFTK